jgi:hypothetical protein
MSNRTEAQTKPAIAWQPEFQKKRQLMFKPFRFMRSLGRIASIAALLALAQLVNAQRPEPPPLEERRYEDGFTFKYGKSFSKDPWTWGYTKEFAEQFRMPVEWIEPQMQGILAIAFRVSDVGQGVTCGLGGREDNCWPNVICQFDIYYDNRLELPWIKEAVMRDNFLTGISSRVYLWQHPPLWALRYNANPVGPIWGPNVGSYGPLPLRLGFTDTERKAWQFPADFAYYDQEFATGVGLIGLRLGACGQPFRKVDYWLGIFANKEAQEKSKGLPRNQLKSIGLVHEALVPAKYIERAEAARVRSTEKDQQIMNRLLREHQQRSQSK